MFQFCVGIEVWGCCVVGQVFKNWLVVVVETVLFREGLPFQLQHFDDFIVDLVVFLLLSTGIPNFFNKFGGVAIVAFYFGVDAHHETFIHYLFLLKHLFALCQLGHIHSHSHQFQ